MSTKAGRSLPLLVATLLLAACALGPRRIALPPSETLPEHRDIEVWRDGKAVRIRHLEFDVDTLRGQLSGASAECDSCDLAIPIAEIDSLRLGRDDRTSRIIVGVPVATFALVTMVWGMSATE
jgi:hypothetical protein